MRLLKLLTLFLAFSSLAALIVATRALPPTTYAAEAVRPSMHYAYVRMQGAVVSFPLSSAAQLSFWLFDGTGSVQVVVPRTVFVELLARGTVPAPGDRIAAEGSLRLYEGAAFL